MSQYNPNYAGFSFQSDSSAFPVFRTDDVLTREFIPTPERWMNFGFVDKTDDPMELFKNVESECSPEHNFAFPSLMFPHGIVDGYNGYMKTHLDDIYHSPICPITTGRTGCKGLGQIGETQCVDPIVSYTDSDGKTHFLMGIKKVPSGTFRMIVGGGMMEPHLDIYENMLKEIREEGLKGQDVDWLMDAIKKGSIIFVGYIPSSRSTDNRWMTTVAVHVRITEEQAKLLNLVSDPSEDCHDPHWYCSDRISSDPMLNPFHRMLLNRAFYDKARYINFPDVFWSRKQLEHFRSRMKNLSKENSDTTWASQSFDEKPYFIAGPCEYDRVNLWKNINSLLSEQSDIVIIDPINYQMFEENRPWQEALEHYYLDHPNVTTVFVLPKNMTPNVTFDEMQRVSNKENVLLFIQEGFPLASRIPLLLMKNAIFYKDEMEVAQKLINISV